MEIVGTLVIAADTIILPVAELPAEVRCRFEADEGDFAIMRRNARASTRIVDSNAARLFQEFQKPATVVQAVIRFCKENSGDPQKTLEAAFPLLERMVDARLLVAVGAPETMAVQPIFNAGTVFEGYEILACIQTIEDTDVYKVRTSEGELAALKLMRSAKDLAVGSHFDREERVLNHLRGSGAPLLLRAGIGEGHRFLLLSWVEGSQCTAIAKSLRDCGDHAGLLRFAVAILEAYAQLHAHSVIHADIHPGNVLVGENRQVRLVDFGLARITPSPEASRDLQRGGVAYFFEPEYAEAMRRHGRPPQASFAGEQYALGALLYLLLSGKHYLNLSLDRKEMERQIVEDAPLAFSSQAVEPWPEVEAVLARALSKHAAARFASVAEFAEALSAVSGEQHAVPTTTRAQPAETAANDMLQRFLKRLDYRQPLFKFGVKLAPRASLTYGTAGIAFALHRIACAGQDARVLSLADLWSERAVRDSRLEDAWYRAEVGITVETVGDVSPYHTEAGVHLTSALIANAMCDQWAQQKGVDGFIAASSKPRGNLDVTLGRSGTVLAASHLMAALSGSRLVKLEQLRNLGDDTLASIWREIDCYAPIRECREISYTGVAHGWAGILYAALCWSRASSAPVPSGIEERLDQLADLASHSRRQAWWSADVNGSDSPDAPLVASWCNGTAGHVFLWLAAAAALGEERYLSLAEQAGHHAAQTNNGIGSLCCGLSGQAYALLALYRQTGDSVWLSRARSIAEKAALSWSSMPAADTLELGDYLDSLYKGELGVAVLAADLESPSASAFPAFELIEF